MSAWQLMPVEPTEEMLQAGAVTFHRTVGHPGYTLHQCLDQMWRAMCKAAPPLVDKAEVNRLRREAESND